MENLKPDYLMWNLHKDVVQSNLPNRRTVVRFNFPECEKDEATWWMVSRPGVSVELCMIDPKFDVDLYVESDLQALGSAWMQYSDLQTEIANDRIYMTGDPLLMRTIDSWLFKDG